MKEYYLGLDMGTSTVGWAVTDAEYNLIRKKGKDLWGVREFDEAQTSADRRVHRISRRRRQREQVRNGLLKEYFDDAITAVDPNFFARLENSKYHLEDKDENVRTPNALFNDKGYTDKEYFEEYPTIFHLRMDLIKDNEPKDVRLVYLAINNIFKHRGHFLNAGLNADECVDMQNAVNELYALLEEHNEDMGVNLPYVDASSLEKILGDKTITRSAKKEKICELMCLKKDQKQEIAFVKAMCGLKEDASQLFKLELEEKVAIEFSSFGYDEKEPEIEAAIGSEYFDILCLLKNIYSIGALSSVLKGYEYLSEARIADYEKHGYDLSLLKSVIKKYGSEKVYNDIFRSELPGSYSAYVNSVSYDKNYNNGQTSKSRRNMKQRSRKDFYDTVKKVLKTIPASDETEYIFNEIERETFMPKQLTAANGVIPYQVHERELKAILKNASEYLTFLNVKDEDGLTISEKILSLFAFQVPYYIGPVTEKSAANGGNGWVVRKEAGQVLPWNIDKKIDMEKTSSEFINRMVRRCTYIHGEQVMPKCSLLYERYCVLNEINTLKIEGQRIPVSLKQDIYNELFKRGKKVTKKNLTDYLIGRGLITDGIQISGIDNNINNSLGSYGKFKAIIDDMIDTDAGKKMAEDIIFWCTIYGDSKKFLIHNIEKNYPELSPAQIKRISGIKFKDWGRLSKEFLLMEGINKETGEYITLLTALWETQLNLMELLNSDDFTFKDVLNEKHTKQVDSLTNFTYDMLDEFYFSAPVKRMIWQTLLIIKEITQVMGSEPSRIFIEMTRTDEEKGDKGRKDSRKKELLEKYKSIKDDNRNWLKLIEEADDSSLLRSKKMYLYIKQMGRDMYTGEQINLDQLFDNNVYDIDHIYPRHYVKDDSLHNNLVLVNKTANAHKSDSYPLEGEIRNNAKVQELWYLLKMKGLINEEKYRRLTCTKPFTEEQKADFIARQMVETGQATKGIADLLKTIVPDTEIVYSKARNVSQFRDKYDLIKTRLVNDFHHAHDAYLNIVVGNVYLTKFTRNPRNFIKNEYAAGHKYHLDKMFEYDVIRNGKTAWVADHGSDHGSILTVKKMLQKNTPLITRRSFVGHGGIANQTLYGKKSVKKEGYIPLKSSDIKMADVTKYGGLTSVSTAYFFLVEHEVKGKVVRTIETLPVMYAEKVETNAAALDEYCKDILELKNFSIRLRRINMQSLVKLNGYYVNITGKSKDTLLLRNAVSLCLNQKWVSYIKKIEKYLERGYADKELTAEHNLLLYDDLRNKFACGIFSKKPNHIGRHLENGRDTFVGLPLEKQVVIISEILKSMSLRGVSANLVEIGASKGSGEMATNKKISKNDELILINQSVTGVFESRIDLLTV